MAAPAQVELTPGKVYRTAEFQRWGANPTRLVGRLVREGRLRRLGHGLYFAPKMAWFGETVASNEDLLNAYLNGSPWIYSGPQAWNSLGLGSTGVYVWPLVYNTQRTGLVELGARKFHLRRRAFPLDPPEAYFVIDLLHHWREAGVGRDVIEYHLTRSLRAGRFDGKLLMAMAVRFGTAQERSFLQQALKEAA